MADSVPCNICLYLRKALIAAMRQVKTAMWMQ